ncbi:hypothetical protein LY76DRAFT_262100 [Colletotrichum caudatum]|nr:hypothetical protein LY76DRAFT_262100 [Colletotrichum caudatum]
MPRGSWSSDLTGVTSRLVLCGLNPPQSPDGPSVSNYRATASHRIASHPRHRDYCTSPCWVAGALNTSASRVAPGPSNLAALRRLETGHPGGGTRESCASWRGGGGGGGGGDGWRPEKPREAFLFLLIDRAVIRTAPCLVG